MPRRLSTSFGRSIYQTLEARQLLAADLSTASVPDATYYIADNLQEEVAREHLASHLDTSDLQVGQFGLQLSEIKRGLASTVTRFQQTVHGIPIANAWVTTIQGPEGEFVATHDQSLEGFFDPTCEPGKETITFEASEQLAMEHAEATYQFAPTRGELVWLTGDGVDKSARLVWETWVFGVRGEVDGEHGHDAEEPKHGVNEHGDFLTYVDAFTGEVISQENRIAHFTSGEGEGFYPNPWQTQGSGTNLTDNSDATSGALENQHISFTLEGLDEGTGLLTGEFVDLANLDSTTITDVDADEADRIYNYDRDDPRFEQVQIYHTVDQINRYFHALGFDDDTGVPNGIRDFPTLANAHWFTDDQSFYSSGNDAIHFGDGGVDDGEDGDIIAHEYGHAIQNNQTNWGGGEMGAMGEGFGDYLAASFFQNEGDAAFQAAHAAAVGEWDATSYSSDDPPNLRRVDGNKMYPDDTGGGVHADGEIWSRALWDLNQDIGMAAADQLVLESHFLIVANASMVDGAEAILLADENLNDGLYEPNIRAAFEARGILEAPMLTGVLTLNNAAYGPGDTIEINVTDENGPDDIEVTLVSSNGDTETLTITGTSGSYTTTIGSVESDTATAGDGIVQAAIGDTFTVSYVDTNDDAGGTTTASDSAVFQDISTYPSDDTPIDIDDNSTITSTITITDFGTLLDLDLQLDITHTWVSDLTAVLTAPDGQEITLFDRIGGNGDDYTDTRFDDDADTDIGAGTAPFTGTFRPEQAFAPLNGQVIAGDWVLSITDAATQDTGSLNNWSLILVVDNTPVEIGPVTDANAAANEVAEDATVGTTVGVTASASDPDSVVTYELLDDAEGLFAIDENSGVVTVAAALDFESNADHTIIVRANSDDGSSSEASFTIDVTNVNDAAISTRQIYYYGSSYDSSSTEDAVASDKQFLENDQTATFANYSSYSLGINGLSFELNDLNQTPTIDNVDDFFSFNVGNENSVENWTPAPAPISVDYQENIDEDGTDRVILRWADNAIENTWLQINILEGDDTGLVEPDVFYFGNAIGESGDSAGDAFVNASDVGGTRQNLSGFFPVGIESPYDYNRDRFVNAQDINIVRRNLSGFFPLLLITPTPPDDGGGNPLKNSNQFDPSTGGSKPLAPVVGLDSGSALGADPVVSLKGLEGAILTEKSAALSDSPSSDTATEKEQDRVFLEFDFGNDFDSLSN